MDIQCSIFTNDLYDLTLYELLLAQNQDKLFYMQHNNVYEGHFGIDEMSFCCMI